MGKKRCATCGGDGKQNCDKCLGKKKLRKFLKFSTSFGVRRDAVRVLDEALEGEFPDHLVDEMMMSGGEDEDVVFEKVGLWGAWWVLVELGGG